MDQVPRSALAIGIAGAVFFVVAGVYGLVRSAIDGVTGSTVIFVLFLLLGCAALAVGIRLLRRR